jgi:hypothetical protein
MGKLVLSGMTGGLVIKPYVNFPLSYLIYAQTRTSLFFSFLEGVGHVPGWRWNKSGLFSTKSVYEHLTNADGAEVINTYGKPKSLIKSKFSCGYWN